MIARVPATSANLGPGFDCLGMAVTMWAEIGVVDVDPLPDRGRVIDERHLATVAFRRAGGTGTLWEASPIPMARGLGYSAAARVGGLLVACAQRHDTAAGGDAVIAAHADEVLALATELEGHADNAAPAVLGGVVVSSGGRSLPVPIRLDPAVVVWVPTFATRTDQSRSMLAPTVSRADAVFNIGRAAMLVAALAAGDAGALGHATDDRLHQPQRFDAAPASLAAAVAARDAGAWCAWLSGSGPTVAALCAFDQAESVAAALPADGHSKVLRIDHVGATLTYSET